MSALSDGPGFRQGTGAQGTQSLPGGVRRAVGQPLTPQGLRVVCCGKWPLLRLVTPPHLLPPGRQVGDTGLPGRFPVGGGVGGALGPRGVKIWGQGLTLRSPFPSAAALCKAGCKEVTWECHWRGRGSPPSRPSGPPSPPFSACSTRSACSQGQCWYSLRTSPGV